MLLAWNGAQEEHAERVVERSYFVSVLHILPWKLSVRFAAKEGPEYCEIHLTRNVYGGSLVLIFFFECECFLYQY